MKDVKLTSVTVDMKGGQARKVQSCRTLGSGGADPNPIPTPSETGSKSRLFSRRDGIGTTNSKEIL